MQNQTYNIREEDSKAYIALLSLFLFVFAFFCSKMSPLYPSNEWSDINIYHTIGKAIAHGKTLYVDIFDHKGPLIFIIYALAYKISGFQFLGMFIILYALWLSVLVHLYHSLNLYIGGLATLCVCFLTVYFSLNYSHSGGSPEEFILLANLFILSVLLRYIQQNKPRNTVTIKRRDLIRLGLFSLLKMV